MKPMMKNFATLMFFLGASVSMTGSSPDISVVDAGQKSFALYIENSASDYVVVALQDVNGVRLLTDRVKNETSFARKYNLVNLPAGDYTLVVEDGAQTTTQRILLDQDEITIPEGSMTKLFAPSIQVNQEKLDFTMLCLDATSVTLEIIDEAGNENYAATTLERGSMQRRFDISALESGKYTVITKVQGQNFEKTYREVFTLGADIAGN